MPEEFWGTLVAEIGKVSPYALIMLASFSMICYLFHRSVKELRAISEQAIVQIREGFKDSMEEMHKMYEVLASYRLQTSVAEKKKGK